MRTSIQYLSDSLAVRIPKPFAAELHLDHGSEVDLTLVNGQLVIMPAPAVTLNELLEGVTVQNIHHEIDTGDAVGQEAW
jgi:antitoxin MazE